MMKMEDDKLSQIINLNSKQIKEMKPLLQSLKTEICECLDWDLGFISIEVESNESDFNNLIIHTDEAISNEEIEKIGKILGMKNKWNDYRFFEDYDY